MLPIGTATFLGPSANNVNGSAGSNTSMICGVEPGVASFAARSSQDICISSRDKRLAISRSVSVRLKGSKASDAGVPATPSSTFAVEEHLGSFEVVGRGFSSVLKH